MEWEYYCHNEVFLYQKNRETRKECLFPGPDAEVAPQLWVRYNDIPTPFGEG